MAGEEVLQRGKDAAENKHGYAGIVKSLQETTPVLRENKACVAEGRTGQAEDG